MPNRTVPLLLGCGLLLAGPSPTLAQSRGSEPLSAIDWLSQSVATAPAGVTLHPTRPEPAKPAEPPVVKGGALPETVATTSLDLPSPDGAGLIAPAVSGLPRDLWGKGLTEEVAQAITRNRMDSIPALRQLFLTMLLAETAPPIDSSGSGILLQARIDKLLQLGALEQAAALINVAGEDTPGLFRREFDIALLTGNEDRACQEMSDSPGLAPTLPARVFCLARGGEWDAAALTLSTAKALGHIPEGEADLLARFLDPDLFDGSLPPPPPNPITPLYWKIYEAIGETLPTSSLPVAFAYAELGQQSGWKSQIEAAERLTRTGTIAPNLILGLYTERRSAASGGVWERVDAFQAFDSALNSNDATRVAQSLPTVWSSMQEAELEVPFAILFGRQLQDLGLTGSAGETAFRIGLLTPGFEQIARAHPPADQMETFLIGLATGDLAGRTPPDSMGRAIAPAFLNPAVSPEAKALLDGGRLGEALLLAISEIARGVEGDQRGVTQGLSLLRAVKLESVARRTALELMILERRG